MIVTQAWSRKAALKILTEIAADSAQEGRGHLENLDQEVTMISFSGMPQLKVGPKPVAT